jgi:hypothetical protein
MADAGVYRVCGIRLDSAVGLPELTRVAGSRADCAFSVSRAAVPTHDVEWFHRWRLKSRRTWARIGRGSDRYVLRFSEFGDFEVSACGRRIVAHAAHSLPPATLRHLLLDQVLPLTLGRMGRTAIHASAVHVPGLGVVAFAGRAGCGKSALAAALAREGCAVMSDDCLVIAVRPDGVWAVPSYPGVRLWPDVASRLGYRGPPVAHYSDKLRVRSSRTLSAERPARLRALFLLSPPSSEVRTVAVSARTPLEGFIGLTRSAYLLDFKDPAALTWLFNQLGALSERVPMAGLRLAKDRLRLRELAREVRKAAGRLAHAVSC